MNPIKYDKLPIPERKDPVESSPFTNPAYREAFPAVPSYYDPEKNSKRVDRMRRVEDNKGCLYVVGVLIRWLLLGLILFIALNLLLAIFGTGGITYAQALVAASVLDNLFNILRFFFH